MKKNTTLLGAFLLSMGSLALSAQPAQQIVVQADKLGAPIQPTMYGLFFEDINYAADGGLYAELIKNRSFEFPQNFKGWNVFGNVTLMDDGPFKNNPHYVRLSYAGHSQKHTGIENEGFFGIGVKKGQEYRFSVWAKGNQQKIRVELVKNNSMEENQAFATSEIAINSNDWTKYEVILKSPITEAHAHLRIFLASQGPVDLEHVSLFPVDTWKGHKNGLRKDLAQALYDIHPGVMRFPGGCIVEGTDTATRYNWKKSIGPVENRPLNENRWHYTFTNRFYPDYFQSYGLGFFEFFQLSEEIGAEPLPIISCGLACQFQNGVDAHVKVNDLGSYIQDALDLIEFANGDTTSKWGSVRAKMGHPAPFNLHYLGVGNEQWGPEYIERLVPFLEAIRKAYPNIKIVGGAGPNSEGDQFDYLWREMKALKPELVDEHFYRPESWFLSQGNRYDTYDRKGPKVFAGEYACHGRGKKYNHFNASLLEAAFMTGIERNADIVQMATYAPLFAHVDGWQWRPDLIWFDNLQSTRTCSYYVQQLYSCNRGTNVLPISINGSAKNGGDEQKGLFASAVYDKNDNTYIIKVVNTSDNAQAISISLKGLKKGEAMSGGKVITFSSSDLDADNTVANPAAVLPAESSITAKGSSYDAEIAPKTFAIYKFNKTK